MVTIIMLLPCLSSSPNHSLRLKLNPNRTKIRIFVCMYDRSDKLWFLQFSSNPPSPSISSPVSRLAPMIPIQNFVGSYEISEAQRLTTSSPKRPVTITK